MLEINQHGWRLGLYAIALAATILLVGAVRRVYFHRLSHLPGPKLAALTYLYQSYFNIYPYQGRWLWQQIALHEKYGPIVRVGPDELHIADPKFFHQAFGSPVTRKRDKSVLWFWASGSGTTMDGGAFNTLDHKLHAMRRAAMNPFFSMKKVRELEGRIKFHVERMKNILVNAGQAGEVINLDLLTNAMTMDVISEYSFGNTTGRLTKPDLGKELQDGFEVGMKLQPIGRQFRPLMLAMMKAVDIATSYIKSPALEYAKTFDNLIEDLAKPAYDKALARGKAASDLDDPSSIIEALALDPRLPPQEKLWKRLCAEAGVLLGAGTHTTARTLTVGLYHILANPAVHKQLSDELRTVMPSADSELPSVVELAKLPYLTACIHEATRLGHGVAGRIVRIAPEEDIHYHDYVIPRGSTYSMSGYIQHMDPTCFPEPEKFIPERYLGETEKATEALKYLVPFSKGPRMCIGIQLAWSEMYLTIAALLGGVEMELAGSTDYDVAPAKEYMVAFPEADSKGVMVGVVGKQG